MTAIIVTGALHFVNAGAEQLDDRKRQICKVVRVFLLLFQEELVEGFDIGLSGESAADALGEFDDAVPTGRLGDDAADGRDFVIYKRSGHGFVSGDHEVFDEHAATVLLVSHEAGDLAVLNNGAGFRAFEAQGAEAVTGFEETLGGGVLEFQLSLEFRRGGDFGRSGGGAIKPGADAVISELGFVADGGGVALGVGDFAVEADDEFGDDCGTVFVFKQATLGRWRAVPAAWGRFGLRRRPWWFPIARASRERGLCGQRRRRRRYRPRL